MPNASEITQRVKEIIQENPDLQDVWIHGKISEVNSTQQNGALDFTITDNHQKIECVIFEENAHLFADLLVGDNVLVKGRISLHRSEKSEYRFVIKDKQPLGTVPDPASVSTLIEILRNTINKHSDKVQGKIVKDRTVGQAGFRQLHIKNANNAEMIVCVLPPNITTPHFPLRRDAEVSIRGKFDIFSLMSQYQIKIASPNDIQLVSSDPDENGQTVVDAVHAYFDLFETDKFSVEREHEIQFGSRNGFADVVLIDQNGSFAAIAECKVAGYVGHGFEQLKSYLCATDTRFGIFANRTDPEEWEFYENRRRNRFDQIDRSEFETGVVKRITDRERLKDEIKALKKAKDDLGNKESELETEIAQLMQTEHDLRNTHKQLISEIGKKHVQQSELETEIGKLAKTKYDLQDTYKQRKKEIEATTQQHADLKQETTEFKNQKLELETKIGHLEQKEHSLCASDEQRREKIQQFETLFNDLKSGLLDSEPALTSDNSVDPQKTGTGKKLGIVSKFKNLFSKENK